MNKGRLIAFEGIDGAGKNTQLGLTETKLRELKVNFKTIAFPRYDKPSSCFINQYLSLEYPYGRPEEVGPYRASLFYALDRYDASFEIKKWLAEGYLVIADRYFGSNIGFQGGKIEDSDERTRYVEWVYDLEFNKLGIPKPVFSIVLWIPPEVAAARIKAREENEDRKRDSHEINLELLKKSQECYLWAAKHYPEDFKVIKCFEEDRELSEEEVHQKVWEIIKNAIEL